MTDDEIRDLLASLPVASKIVTPPGYVAIMRRLATDAEVDGEEVDDWVKGHRGAIRYSKPVEARDRRRGRMMPQTIPGEPYYAIPAEALKPPD
jgi:hypothetical protein